MEQCCREHRQAFSTHALELKMTSIFIIFMMCAIFGARLLLTLTLAHLTSQESVREAATEPARSVNCRDNHRRTETRKLKTLYVCVMFCIGKFPCVILTFYFGLSSANYVNYLHENYIIV